MVREAVKPPGEARPDLEILLELSSRLGYAMPHQSSSDVMRELAELTPQFAGVTHERLGSAGLQWPVWSADHPGTPVLFVEEFSTADHRAKLCSVDYMPPGEAASERFPLVLVTGRQLAHYNSGTQTRRTGNLQLQSEDWLEINAEDAAKYGLAFGDAVEIESARGKVTTHACVTRRVAPGNVFLSFHFPEVKTNLLTSSVSEPSTKCPEYKVTAVSVKRVEGRAHAPAAAQGFRQDAFD
jgi:formate dehydrogenase major subunit